MILFFILLMVGVALAIPGLLRADWWQGVAGIAQIMAGVLAVVTIQQGRKMMSEAERERFESVSPDWDFVWAEPQGVAAERMLRVCAHFINTGFGPARNVSVDFLPRNGNDVLQLTAQGPGGQTRAIEPDKPCHVRLDWHADRPPEGRLTITCTTRYGHKLQHAFYVVAGQTSDGFASLKVTPTR